MKLISCQHLSRALISNRTALAEPRRAAASLLIPWSPFEWIYYMMNHGNHAQQDRRVDKQWWMPPTPTRCCRPLHGPWLLVERGARGSQGDGDKAMEIDEGFNSLGPKQSSQLADGMSGHYIYLPLNLLWDYLLLSFVILLKENISFWLVGVLRQRT